MTFAERLEIVLYRFFLGFLGTRVPKAVAELFPAPDVSEDDVYKTDNDSRLNVYRRLARHSKRLVEGNLSTALSNGLTDQAFMRVERGEKIGGTLDLSSKSLETLYKATKFVTERDLADDAQKKRLYTALIKKYLNANAKEDMQKKALELLSQMKSKSKNEFASIIASDDVVNVNAKPDRLKALFETVVITSKDGQGFYRSHDNYNNIIKSYDNTKTPEEKVALLRFFAEQDYYKALGGIANNADDNIFFSVLKATGDSFKDLIIESIDKRDGFLTEDLVKRCREKLNDEDKQEILEYILQSSKARKMSQNMLLALLEGIGKPWDGMLSDVVLENIGKVKYNGCRESNYGTYSHTTAFYIFVKAGSGKGSGNCDFLTMEDLEKIKNNARLDSHDEIMLEHQLNMKKMKELGIELDNNNEASSVNAMLAAVRSNADGCKAELFTTQLRAKWHVDEPQANFKLSYEQCSELLGDLYKAHKEQQQR